MDVHSIQQRSFNMSQIKSKNTKPEVLVRKLLWGLGYRYRIHYDQVPGKPDIVFPKRRKAIFINGCFWHRHNCSYFKWPESNAEFWKKKIEGNVLRDNQIYNELDQLGWHHLVVWECETKRGNLNDLVEKMCIFLRS